MIYKAYVITLFTWIDRLDILSLAVQTPISGTVKF